MSSEKPNFESLLGILKKTPNSMASLTWIERLQKQYTKNKKFLDTNDKFPFVVDRQRLEKDFRS